VTVRSYTMYIIIIFNLGTHRDIEGIIEVIQSTVPNIHLITSSVCNVYMCTLISTLIIPNPYIYTDNARLHCLAYSTFHPHSRSAYTLRPPRKRFRWLRFVKKIICIPARGGTTRETRWNASPLFTWDICHCRLQRQTARQISTE